MTNNTHTKIVLIAVLIASATISGCIDDEPITTVEELEVLVSTMEDISEPTIEKVMSTPTPAPTPESYIVEIGETCGTESLIVCIDSFEVVSEYKYMGYNSIKTIYPDFHNVFVIFDCTIENAGARESVYCGSVKFSMEDKDNIRYERSNALRIADIDSLSGLSELYPGQKVTGKLVFEIPKDSGVNTLYYDFGSLFGTNLAGWNVAL